MSRLSRFLVVVTAALTAASGLALHAPTPALALSPDVVISQVYGGGGNTGATFTHDFIELFNRGTSSVSLTGWSVQYASATGTGNFGASSTQLTELPSVSLAPGQYLLVQEASTAAVGSPLPTPDVTDTTPIAMSATAGKVALVNGTASLGCNGGSTPCSPAQLAQIVDLVGYGGANFYEGAAAPTLSNTTAAIRATGGCTETDDNATDFAASTPTPRNTASPLHVCPTIPNLTIDDVSRSEGDAGTTSFDFTVSLSGAAGAGGVTFDVATADGSATVADGDYQAQSLANQAIPAGGTSSAFSVVVNGDTAAEADETLFVNVTNVSGATVVDGQGHGTIVDDDACGEPFTPIYQIQGSGSSAAITGAVTTQGIVVGDFEGSAAASGFYLQDPAGDGLVGTSDGIFVFTGSANLVSAGELVRVTGYARERFNQTTLNGSNSNSAAVPAANIVECGSGSIAPTDVTMPFADTTDLERFEGMVVRFPQSLVIAEYFNYDRFGEIVLALPLEGEDRPFTGTAIDEPGAAANSRTLANSLRRITLDDVQSAQNPPSLRHPNGDPFALDNRFRGGDRVEGATGVLGFDFSLYRILPTAAADYTAVNLRPPAPEPVGGRLRVAAMNTLNFFLTLDYPSGGLDNACGPAQDVECRGADFGADPSGDAVVDDEFQRQRTKLLEALIGLDADVLGLNEIENTTGVDPLGDPTRGIVPGLNDLLGAGTYAAIDTGVIGTDAIRVGLIYKPSEVTPIGAYQTLDSADDPRFDSGRSRPALAQTFEENATGARFTVVVNHLKSKGDSGLAGTTASPGICLDADPGNDVPDCDQGDGQGYWNHTRTLAAQAIVDWLATDPTGSGDPDFLVVGDLNSYAMEDPIDAVKAGPDDTGGTGDDYTNLVAQFQGTYAYSYTFDGQAGYLDHALANASLAGQVTGAADWHINSDEPDVLDYDVSFKPEAQDRLFEPNEYRTSDHDPIVIGLDLDAPPTIEVSAAGSACTPGGGVFAVTLGDLHTPTANLALTLTGNTNTALVPSANVVIAGSGSNRTIAITAAVRHSGTAVLTFTVDDGIYTTDLVVTVQVGTDADEVLSGTAGSDLILGGAGADDLEGAAGADILCGGNGADHLGGGTGDDVLDGGRGDDSLAGGDGNDVLRGGLGSDSLSGEAGDDRLTGGSGADAFSGGPGTDVSTDVTPSQGDTTDGT